MGKGKNKDLELPQIQEEHHPTKFQMGTNKDLELPLEGEIKYLNLEIGKLKSYITELEYKNSELIKIGKKFEKEKNELQKQLVDGIPAEIKTAFKKLIKQNNQANDKIQRLTNGEVTKTERKKIAQEVWADFEYTKIITENLKLRKELKELKVYQKNLTEKWKKEKRQYEKILCDYLQLKKEKEEREQAQNQNK